MRELKECKAEIFRRSEERIRERKRKQKCLAVWSVSFCLCACLGAKLFLPGMSSANQVFPEGEDQPLEDAGDQFMNDEGLPWGDNTYVKAEILVKGNVETAYKVTDKAEVDRMYGAILSIVHDSDGEIPESAEGENDLNNLPSADEMPDSEQSSNKEDWIEKPSIDEIPEANTEHSSEKEDFETESESESVVLPPADSENSSEKDSEENKNSELESEDFSGLPSSSETEKDSEVESGNRVESLDEAGFIIIFKNVEGKETVYLIKGNCLIVQETGEQFILEKSQLKELKLALGL